MKPFLLVAIEFFGDPVNSIETIGTVPLDRCGHQIGGQRFTNSRGLHSGSRWGNFGGRRKIRQKKNAHTQGFFFRETATPSASFCPKRTPRVMRATAAGAAAVSASA